MALHVGKHTTTGEGFTLVITDGQAAAREYIEWLKDEPQWILLPGSVHQARMAELLGEKLGWGEEHRRLMAQTNKDFQGLVLGAVDGAWMTIVNQMPEFADHAQRITGQDIVARVAQANAKLNGRP